eukprot:366101-Chlamydomonas_euryale.AAC.15
MAAQAFCLGEAQQLSAASCGLGSVCLPHSKTSAAGCQHGLRSYPASDSIFLHGTTALASVISNLTRTMGASRLCMLQVTANRCNRPSVAGRLTVSYTGFEVVI